MVLLITVIAAVSWSLVLKRLDTARDLKKNKRYLRMFFGFGILSIPLVLILSGIVEPILRPFTGGSTLIEQIFLVGLVEETGKFLVFFLIAGSSAAIREPRDGVLHAASVGLAFAVVENVVYSVYGIDTLLLRSVLTTTGHMSYASIWGAAAGVYLYNRRAPGTGYSFSIVIGAVITSALIHGLYNSFLDAGIPALALILDAGSLFLALKILSYMKQTSPFAHIPLSRYREAIPLLNAALASNPNNFYIHKRLALYCIRAGRDQEAAACLQRARVIEPRELSARFYLELLRYLFLPSSARETGRQPLYAVVSRLSGKSLKKIRLQCEELFPSGERQRAVSRLLAELMDYKAGRMPAGSARSSRRIVNSPSAILQSGSQARTFSGAAPEEQERKLRAFGRIIDGKKNFLEPGA